jgi:hypothetical protein
MKGGFMGTNIGLPGRRNAMKSRILMIGFLLALGAGPAMGQTACDSTSDANTLTRAQISQLLLSTRYACGLSYASHANEKFNEILDTGAANVFSGTFSDYRRGPGDAKDPKKQVGTYVITAEVAGAMMMAGTPATIAYTYTGGYTYTYTVTPITGGPTGVGTYSFCQSASTDPVTDINSALTVTVSTATTTCFNPALP